MAKSIRAEAYDAAGEFLKKHEGNISKLETEIAAANQNQLEYESPESRAYYKFYAELLERRLEHARAIEVARPEPRVEREEPQDIKGDNVKKSKNIFGQFFQPPEYPEDVPSKQTVSQRIEHAQDAIRRSPRRIWMPLAGLLIGFYLGGTFLGGLQWALVLGGIFAREGAARAGVPLSKQYAWGIGPSLPMVAGRYEYLILSLLLHVFAWNWIPWVTHVERANTTVRDDEDEEADKENNKDFPHHM